jgi:hypothetical protein
MNIDHLIDQNGRVIRWPKKKDEKLEVLKYLNSKFENGRDYLEKEVNEIINKWHLLW